LQHVRIDNDPHFIADLMNKLTDARATLNECLSILARDDEPVPPVTNAAKHIHHPPSHCFRRRANAALGYIRPDSPSGKCREIPLCLPSSR
jgi:hypothetical protein